MKSSQFFNFYYKSWEKHDELCKREWSHTAYSVALARSQTTVIYLSLSLTVWHPLPHRSLVFLLARSSYLSPLIFLFSIHSVCASFLSIPLCVRLEYALWCLVAFRPLVEEVIIRLMKISSHYQSTFNQWTSSRLQIIFSSLYT